MRFLRRCTVVVLAAVLTVGSVACNRGGLFSAGLADQFFGRYVDDGRVIRRDEGSDTVSEGQAYALLLAVALDDERRFDEVWSWTKEHLVRGDGLLMWRWRDGTVVDSQPAADADIDAAHALFLAGNRFERSDLTAAAKRMTRSIISNETIEAETLVAGPWARERGIVNPSYIDPNAFDAFARATGDARWKTVARRGVKIVSDATSNGTKLPPDWVKLDDDQVVPIASPDDEQGAPRYGFDAPRVLLRFADSCDKRASALAADLAGVATPGDDADHPFRLMSAAAGAQAARDTDRRDELLQRAEDNVHDSPSYYGWAWVALGRAMLAGEFRDCV